MTIIRSGAALVQIQALYGAGTCSGLSDRQLLDRYLAGRGERAEAAFTALVERHGPMVLRVCRGVLRDAHDAEDAFQATFLVLARRAGSIRRRDSLESWLFGVASRVSHGARAGAARRRRHERKRAERTAEAIVEAVPDDLGSMIQREVGRLPDRLRAAVVLCYLEGRTCEQAADRLNLPVGTIKSRLSGARERLRSRLARSGYGPEAADPAVWPLAGPLIVPARLARSTAASVMASAMGRSAPGAAVPVPVAVLARGVLRGMILCRLMAGAALVLAVAALAWVATAAGADGRGRSPEQPALSPPPAAAPPAVAPPPPARSEPGQAILAWGVVVDPDGRRVPGASVRLMILGGGSGHPDRRTMSDPDGRFVLSLPRDAADRLAEAREGKLRVVATAAGYGLGWADPGPGNGLVVPLVADSPIEGRILDAQGRPIAGVKVKTHNSWASPREDLAAFIEDVKRRGEAPWTGARPLELVTYDAAATTDADGRFRLEGIGRERVAGLTISGPTIVTEDVYAMTRIGPAVRPVGWEGLEPGARTYRGARFEHAAAPCTPIAGTVRDVETGEPLAGIKLRAEVESVEGRADHPGASATTGDRGRYVLTGLPPGRKVRLRASSTRGLPYVGRDVPVNAEAVAGPTARCDIALRKGVLVRGRVTDQVTGQPLGASVAYFPFPDDPRLKDYPAGGHQGASDDDGRFAIAVPPCRGVLIALARGGRYVRAVGADRIQGLDRIPDLFGRPYRVDRAPDYQFAVEISPAAGAGPLTRDLQPIPARTVTGTVVDPDGKPVVEAVAMGLDANMSWGDRVLLSADFAVEAVDPGSPRRVCFFHVGRRLAGSALIRGDETGPLTVRLQPWGVVTGRIVDHQGKPQPAVLTSLYPNRDPEAGMLPRRARAGTDGRFRIEGLVPGLRYTAAVLEDGSLGFRRAFRDVRVGPGETRDLGDVKLQRYDPGKDD